MPVVASVSATRTMNRAFPRISQPPWSEFRTDRFCKSPQVGRKRKVSEGPRSAGAPYMVYGKHEMEKTTLYLPGELQVALRDAARRAGVPQAELVREALTRYLGTLPRPVPRSIGIMADGTIDASEVKSWIRREMDRDYDRYLRDAGPGRSKAKTPRRRKAQPSR
ncbi:MAG: CopG family transcriptional regulator [Actinomycetota bacterium]